MNLARAAREAGLPEMTVYQRIHRGWPVKKALSTPVRLRAPAANDEMPVERETTLARYCVSSGRLNVQASARAAGLSVRVLRDRLKRGWPVDLALATPVRGYAYRELPPPPAVPNRRGAYVARRIGLPVAMTLGEAKAIAGTLGKTTKMPGYSYGLDAFQCITGSELAKDPSSTCAKCFARRNFYATWIPAKVARERRHAGLEHPRWMDAMVLLISHYCAEEPCFRWHDSGDLMSVEHLERIAEVCRRTPEVKHWLPTREYGFVEEFLRRGGVIPQNLVIRLSAYMLDKRPKVPKALRHLPVSTVHTGEKAVWVGPRRNSQITCRAPDRDGQCGPCRACWSPKVKSVSYKEH